MVDNDVINQKFMNHYRVGSRFGVFSAIGNDELFVRIREIEALESLQEMSKGRVFMESAGDAVTDTVENVGDAMDDPSATAQELGSGFSRLFKRLGRMSRNAYEKGRSMVSKNYKTKEPQKEKATGSGLAKDFWELTALIGNWRVNCGSIPTLETRPCAPRRRGWRATPPRVRLVYELSFRCFPYCTAQAI